MIKFKENFIFGGSMSSIQSDGKGPFKNDARTNFNLLFENNKESFFDMVGPEITSDFINNYKSDIKLFKQVGINGIRHSFSWAKLFPYGKNEKPDVEVVKYYHDLFSEMKNSNITRLMSLMHFDLPEYIAIDGGIISKTFVEDFVKFAQFIFNEYGNEVEYFATFNEPFVQLSASYLSDGIHGHWPLEKNEKIFFTAVDNIIIANAKIIESSKQYNLNQKVGIVIDFNTGLVRNKNNPEDVKSAEMFNAFREEIFLEPSINGVYSQKLLSMIKTIKIETSIVKPENAELISKNRASWLGVNYYTPLWIKEKKVKKIESIYDFFDFWDNPLMMMNKSRGWEIKPEILYNISMRIKKEYGNIKWMVTENGIAIENEIEDYTFNNEIVDDYRIEFFKLHLNQLHKAITDGSNCIGYLMWTPIDSWSSMNAYKNRYGLISLDIKTQKRKIKKSGYWWKEMSKRKGF